MTVVFPGWYIQVSRVGFLSKHWEVKFYDGINLKISTRSMGIGLSKIQAEDWARELLENICKDALERMKEESPEMFNEILRNRNAMWDAGEANHHVIPLGEIARKLYPEETKLAQSGSDL